jgi:hypothetical protein
VPKHTNRFQRPTTPAGKPAKGLVVRLMVGQGHGYIRLADDREIYFHRADMQEGASFNALNVGDVVRFALLEDAVSGARALRVRRTSST